jgi:hypothetical protein
LWKRDVKTKVKCQTSSESWNAVLEPILISIEGEEEEIVITGLLYFSAAGFSVCSHHLSFQAREESEVLFPPPVVKTEVTVIITDVNDEIPTFRTETYLAEVNENAQANTPVTFLNNAVPEVFDHDQVTLHSAS